MRCCSARHRSGYLRQVDPELTPLRSIVGPLMRHRDVRDLRHPAQDGIALDRLIDNTCSFCSTGSAPRKRQALERVVAAGQLMAASSPSSPVSVALVVPGFGARSDRLERLCRADYVYVAPVTSGQIAGICGGGGRPRTAGQVLFHARGRAYQGGALLAGGGSAGRRRRVQSRHLTTAAGWTRSRGCARRCRRQSGHAAGQRDRGADGEAVCGRAVAASKLDQDNAAGLQRRRRRAARSAVAGGRTAGA